MTSTTPTPGIANVVVPMAGRGSRFAAVGVRTPKPLIDVLGKPMYAWAVDSLPIDGQRLILICLREHADVVEQDARRRYGGRCALVVQALDAVTRGQAETVLAARALIDDDAPLLIYNADTCEQSASLAQDLRALATAGVDGVLSVFAAPPLSRGADRGPDKWSFARTADGTAASRVVETAEKLRISTWASTGLYWFRRGARFVSLAAQAIAADDRSGGEFYVAPLYQRMIDAGEDVRIHVADRVDVLGTPEDLDAFLQRQQQQQQQGAG